MKYLKGFFLILILIGCQFSFSADKYEITKLSEVGYNRNYSWDKEVVRVCIKCNNGKIQCQIEIETEGKIKKKESHKIRLKSYLKLWDYINDKSIMFLKSGALLNGPSISDEEFFALYKKIPRQYAYIYDFYFIIGNEKHSFTVDDVGYIRDARYLDFLKKINKVLKIETKTHFFSENSWQ